MQYVLVYTDLRQENSGGKARAGAGGWTGCEEDGDEGCRRCYRVCALRRVDSYSLHFSRSTSHPFIACLLLLCFACSQFLPSSFTMPFPLPPHPLSRPSPYSPSLPPQPPISAAPHAAQRCRSLSPSVSGESMVPSWPILSPVALC